MDGELRFRSLSHFQQIEDGKVRGDPREGSISYQPIGGLMGHNDTQGEPFHVADGSFIDSRVRTDEIFILCACNSMTDGLRIRFKAKACVQILRPGTLRERIEYALPPTATVLAQKVTYYSLVDVMGTRWYFGDKIAFSKVDDYAWQDEFRFVFALGGALRHGNTTQNVVIPNQSPGTALPPVPPLPHDHDVKVKPLGSICKLHLF